MDYSKRLTDNARAALTHSEILAYLSKSDTIETVHLLLGIIDQPKSVAAQMLNDYNINVGDLRSRINVQPGVVVTTNQMSKPFSEASKLTMRMAVNMANEFGEEKCGTVHMLFAILSQRDSKAYELLSNQGIDIDSLLAELGQYMGGQVETVEIGTDGAEMQGGRQTNGSFLAKYSTDLTKAARDGKLDPVIGRNAEIDRLITIISRRTKNNPVLIGEAGVGKTAVVEGLAQRITSGTVPSFLADRKLIEVDLAAMVAGTKYRGEFEDRLKRLIREVERDDKLIVFIDEIHLLVGAGSAEGSMDAANLLKPALARGKFRLIGATTNDEYRKRIEKDAALTRRLQEIEVNPPATNDVIRILTGLAPKYEQYHHVKISEAVINEIVRLSDRYLYERQQPDKAIDVLDETAARARIAIAGSDGMRVLKDYQSEMSTLTKDMEKAVADEDYEHAALYKMRVSQLKDKIEELKNKQQESGWATIKVNDVATTVSRMTGIPLEQLKRSEAAKLANLEKRLRAKVIGQDTAVTAVARAIRRSRAGVADNRRPIGSFIFLGPTGVGKTELAKVLAEEVFGSRDNLIKVDMSEFSERHNVARLVGAPAGYVGYDDGGQLTEKVRRQPYSVILFDEIEKAHPDVFNILLQILEDGTLTDGHGKKADFRNCVVILTSNVGVEELTREQLGFAMHSDEQLAKSSQRNRHEEVMKVLRQTMRPELLNRFDQIILFNNLTDKEVGSICDIMLGELSERLVAQGIALVISPKLRRKLVGWGYDPKYGARPLRRAIQDKLESVLADQLIAGAIKRGDVVKADLTGDEIVLTRQAEKVSKSSAKTTK